VKREVIEADVICVGGGIAGLMAAIRAAELGAKVVVAEKGNTLRSGAGASGNDHFFCYMPDVHGTDMNAAIAEWRATMVGGKVALKKGMAYVRTWFGMSLDIVKLWDSWGIPMTYRGKYEFAGHAFPGHPLMRLKYSGQDQKRVLSKEARKRGAIIRNRLMVFDLLGDGSISGALGIDTREDKLVELRAKSVVLGTGGCIRLYPSPTPGWMSNLEWTFGLTGGGRAMAYRAGAELVDMEMPYRHAGPKYLAGIGKATWVGVLRDPQGKPVSPFVKEPSRQYGDVGADVYQTVFEDYAKSGRGPVYMDCRGISDEDYEYMTYWLEQEGNLALLDHWKDEGIDPRKHRVEFMTYGMTHIGGVYYNDKTETSMQGVYAAGDEFGSGISGAAVYGWVAGENAAGHARTATPPAYGNDLIEDRESLFEDIRSREVGPGWREANVALQQVMQDHAGTVRSESSLNAGLNHLRRLKEKARSTMIARNQHELMRCVEVLDLLDLGELVFLAALERKETRGKHVRPDYPFTNPLLDGKLLTLKRVGNSPVIEWKETSR